MSAVISSEGCLYMMLLNRLLLGLCMVALLLAARADSCQAKSKGKDKAPPADVFTPPVEMNTDIPIFVDGAGKALKPFDATGADGSEPTIDVIKRLPSLSNPQRKALDKMQAESRVQQAAIQEGIKSMQSQLKNRRTSSVKSITFSGPKTHPLVSAAPEKDVLMDMQQNEMQQEGMVQEQVPEEEIKAKIQSSTEQIRQANKQLWQSVTSVLTPQQRDELEKMRRGQLMITTSASSQSPTGKGIDTMPGAQSSNRPESVSESINKAALKRILSNQAKHEKVQDFSGL
jgi:hypothetical protein